MFQYYVIADTVGEIGLTYYFGNSEAKAKKEITRLQSLPTVVQIRYRNGKQVQKIDGLAKN